MTDECPQRYDILNYLTTKVSWKLGGFVQLNKIKEFFSSHISFKVNLKSWGRTDT